MITLEEVERLAIEADAEFAQESEPQFVREFAHNYALRHTHEVNGIRVERVHGHVNGTISHAARRFASFFHN